MNVNQISIFELRSGEKKNESNWGHFGSVAYLVCLVNAASAGGEGGRGGCFGYRNEAGTSTQGQTGNAQRQGAFLGRTDQNSPHVAPTGNKIPGVSGDAGRPSDWSPAWLFLSTTAGRHKHTRTE